MKTSHLVSAALFVATCVSTTAVGGVAFSLPLMTILVAHEMGHYVTARIHGVPASPPYFVPMPIALLGTMGAVIVQSETADRRKLIDIGAAGPLAGLVVAIPVLFYGLTLSPVGPPVPAGWQEGNSLLYAILKYATKGEWLPGAGRDVLVHPTAMAGWAGLFVTMLNLLPIGQLDGGHIATAYFGNRYERAARVGHFLLLLLAVGAFATTYRAFGFDVATMAATLWLVWFLLLWVMRWLSGGRYHPPVDDRPLPRSRVALFWIVVMTFLLVFMPVPLRLSVGSADGRAAPPPERAATTR